MPDERFGLPWGRIRKWQRDGLRVAATDGCFDILHVGHLRMLRWAASQADRLVVLLPDDASVSASKPGRPFVPLRDRAELVAALDPVDAVGHYTQSDLASLYAELAPDVLVNSPEWQGRVRTVRGGGSRGSGRLLPQSRRLVHDELGVADQVLLNLSSACFLSARV